MVGDADSPPSPGTSCRCGAANVKKKACASCVCSKWGRGCQSGACGCRGGPSCHNPFNHIDLPALFGPAPVVLHGCFVDWVLRQRRVPRGDRMTAEWLFDLARGGEGADALEDVDLCAEDVYGEWRARWDGLSAAERAGTRGLELRQELNRMAFTKSEPNANVFYVFCRHHEGSWQSEDHLWHCRVCRECMEWREWHCGKCNKCAYGVSLACQGCGGVSSLYHDLSEDMGRS